MLCSFLVYSKTIQLYILFHSLFYFSLVQFAMLCSFLVYSKTIQLYILFHSLFYFSLVQDTEHNSLGYIVGPFKSILYIIVCIC